MKGHAILVTMTAKRDASAPAVEAEDPHQAEVDGFIARNREPLNESIRRARQELADGVRDSRSIDEIIADGRKRHRSGS